MAAEFSISLDLPKDGAHVVRLAGDLDSATVDEVDRVLKHLKGDVCLDCSELRFVDTAALRRTSLLDFRSVPAAERAAAQGGI
jgi:hypothetical protein